MNWKDSEAERVLGRIVCKTNRPKGLLCAEREQKRIWWKEDGGGSKEVELAKRQHLFLFIFLFTFYFALVTSNLAQMCRPK